jgi:hypothetical protein
MFESRRRVPKALLATGRTTMAKRLESASGCTHIKKPSTAHPCCAQSYASRLTRACGTYLCVGDRVGSGVVVGDGEGLPVGAGEGLAVCTAEGASEGAFEGASEGRTVEPHARSIGAIEGMGEATSDGATEGSAEGKTLDGMDGSGADTNPAPLPFMPSVGDTVGRLVAGSPVGSRV